MSECLPERWRHTASGSTQPSSSCSDAHASRPPAALSWLPNLCPLSSACAQQNQHNAGSIYTMNTNGSNQVAQYFLAASRRSSAAPLKERQKLTESRPPELARLADGGSLKLAASDDKTMLVGIQVHDCHYYLSYCSQKTFNVAQTHPGTGAFSLQATCGLVGR